MALSESLHIDQGLSKHAKYEQLIPQIIALIGDEKNQIAVLANTAAALHETFNFFWTGFYIIEDNELVVGPFQGPVACMRIGKGKGVCGSAWQYKQSIVVPNVEEFPGHIACSSMSKSEIVVPVLKPDGVIFGVLDVDSSSYDTFDEIDRLNLEKLCTYLGTIL